MFKRPPLRVAHRIVNAPFALSMLFLFTACSGADQSPQTSAETDPIETAVAETTAPRDLSLPAVWQTAPLAGEITSIGIADALGSVVAVAYRDGSLQLLNFEGERITDPAQLDAGVIGDGRYVRLQNTPVTFFPALNRDGELVSYIHGGELDAPLEYPLDSGTAETLIGLCTAPPQTESDGVMRIAFWSLEEPRKLKSGRIVEVVDNLIVLLDAPVTADVDINACALTDYGAHIYSAPVIDVANIQHDDRTYLVTLDQSGGYALTNTYGLMTSFWLRDGITVRPPRAPVAMAGTGDARGGGYPNGLIVVAGEAPDGNQSVTFIDPSDLALMPAR